MKLQDYLSKKDCRRIAVIGMSKNAGKTVVLNRLIAEMNESNMVIGITSTGRDGEEEDLVTQTEKPRIYVPVNTILATTEVCLGNSEAKVEILDTTGENTPMGQVVIVKVRQAGFIQIAGPDTNAGIKKVMISMEEHGANRILVDGAIDRKASASPAVSDGCILATGAVLHRDPEQVIKMTKHQVDIYSLPAVEEKEIIKAWNTFTEKGSVAVIDQKGAMRILPIRSAINSGRKLGNALEKGDRWLLVKGSLTGKAVQELMQVTSLYKEVTILMADATKVFITEKEWKLWKHMGVGLKVINPINLLAVTVNPVSPEGYVFDKQKFHREMQQALGLTPVIDVLEEG
ncbi:hypothetical protein SAMN05192551_102377 [Tindallia magadiensis]|uniref:Uncharacterized protein n=1 Tax=Tindallia magadiensis TaxID=69895 RepID=A0A1I3CG14_9FIRM|nr:hypothetical protein [Tindallia magadiensis]SFH73405.1 hypothetical protein SAMN05192551_102377 [Tindallia magadiensis]